MKKGMTNRKKLTVFSDRENFDITGKEKGTRFCKISKTTSSETV